MKLLELFSLIRAPIRQMHPHPPMKVVKPKKPRHAVSPIKAPTKPRAHRQKTHF